jgi:rare lipoprotein A (peptidoglycan hydrolase)
MVRWFSFVVCSLFLCMPSACAEEQEDVGWRKLVLYVVYAGDTLHGITHVMQKRHKLHTSAFAVAAHNNVQNPDLIKPGEKLWIPLFRKKAVDRGIASWYGRPFIGRQTASGDVYTGKGFTAAHKKLAFGTRVRVINLKNGRMVEVEINDRGPFIGDRKIDLSPVAAEALNSSYEDIGLIPVRLELVD